MPIRHTMFYIPFIIHYFQKKARPKPRLKYLRYPPKNLAFFIKNDILRVDFGVVFRVIKWFIKQTKGGRENGDGSKIDTVACSHLFLDYLVLGKRVDLENLISEFLSGKPVLVFYIRPNTGFRGSRHLLPCHQGSVYENQI